MFPCFEDRDTIAQMSIVSVLDSFSCYSLYLEHLDTVYHCAVHFITGDTFHTHHYAAYGKSSLATRTEPTLCHFYL